MNWVSSQKTILEGGLLTFLQFWSSELTEGRLIALTSGPKYQYQKNEKVLHKKIEKRFNISFLILQHRCASLALTCITLFFRDKPTLCCITCNTYFGCDNVSSIEFSVNKFCDRFCMFSWKLCSKSQDSTEVLTKTYRNDHKIKIWPDKAKYEKYSMKVLGCRAAIRIS